MKGRKRKAQRKTVRGWGEAKALLERWRKDLKTLTAELKQPRVIDVVPIDFVSGEPVEREGKPTKSFRGQLIFFTNADLAIGETATSVMASSTPGSATGRIKYRLSVGSAQAAGTYSTIITYIITATY